MPIIGRKKNPNPPTEADPSPTTLPTEAELFTLDNIVNELCIGYGVLLDARRKRQMSVNFFNRYEAQGTLPPNLRFKLSMYQWPICFKSTEADSNHLIEVAILDEALKRIALNRKTILEKDLLAITEKITKMKQPDHLLLYLESSQRDLSRYNEHLTELQYKLDKYIQNIDLNINSLNKVCIDIHDSDNISELHEEFNLGDRITGKKDKPKQQSTLKTNSKKPKKSNASESTENFDVIATNTPMQDIDQISIRSTDESLSELTTLVKALAASVASQTSTNTSTSGNPQPLRPHSAVVHRTRPPTTKSVEQFQSTAAWLDHNNQGMSRQNFLPYADNTRFKL